MVDTREVVDEISTFLTGSVKDIKDMFRIGKKSDDRCRPTIVKFLTVWDKRLLLAAKFKLKSFSKSGIFIRPDLSRNERFAAAAKHHKALNHLHQFILLMSLLLPLRLTMPLYFLSLCLYLVQF